MRKLVVAAWLAVSSIVAAVPAAADSPISLPPLAPGEVLLETNSIGFAFSPATSATISVTVMIEAATEDEARRMTERALAQVTAAARAAGIADADIETGNPEFGDMGMSVSNASDALYTNSITSDLAYGGASMTIRVRNPAAARPLQRTLARIENVMPSEPDYRIEDDSAARRAARADALRRSRADADSYAASMNMRIARVLRVTERTGLDIMSVMAGESALLRDLEGARDRRDGHIQTFAVLGVDYALAPR